MHFPQKYCIFNRIPTKEKGWYSFIGFLLNVCPSITFEPILIFHCSEIFKYGYLMNFIRIQKGCVFLLFPFSCFFLTLRCLRYKFPTDAKIMCFSSFLSFLDFRVIRNGVRNKRST